MAVSEGSASYNGMQGVVNGPLVQAGAIHHVTLAPSEPVGSLPVPRQLVAAVGDFTGRTEYLAALDALLPRAVGGESAADAVMITAVAGTAGVGKTALALRWAHRVQDRFPGGTLYADLRGYGPGEPATPSEVLYRFLRALGIGPKSVPISVDAQAALYRSLLACAQVLIVLDNANSSEQVRPLLPGSPGSLVVVTSRATLGGLLISHAATPVVVDVMTERESVDLLRRIIGDRRAEAEPDGVVELARLCARLPLALRIAASRFASRPYLRIGDFLADMTNDRGRLEVLRAPGNEASGVARVFEWSYRKLTPEQARLFRLLGLHPGLEIGVHAVAAVASVPVARARLLLEDLAEVHLVEPDVRGRYRYHDLLRDYARDCADRFDAPADRGRAVDALLEWYAHNAVAADRLAFPAYVHRAPELDESSAALPIVTTRSDALQWLETERPNLVALIRSVATTHSRWVVSLVHTTETFLYHYAHWNELFDVCALGITAARHLGDRASEAWFLIRSGWAWLQVSGWEKAVNDLHSALALAYALDDAYLMAYALNDLGDICLRQGRYADALAHLDLALPLSRGTDNGRQEAFVETNYSRAVAGLGQYDSALEHAERGLALRERAGDREGAVFTLNQLARLRQAMGDHRKAVDLCEQAIDTGPNHAYQPDIATALDTLGTSLLHLGEAVRARTCWLNALEIFDNFDDHRAAGLRARLGAVNAQRMRLRP